MKQYTVIVEVDENKKPQYWNEEDTVQGIYEMIEDVITWMSVVSVTENKEEQKDTTEEWTEEDWERYADDQYADTDMDNDEE